MAAKIPEFWLFFTPREELNCNVHLVRIQRLVGSQGPGFHAHRSEIGVDWQQVSDGPGLQRIPRAIPAHENPMQSQQE
jgi:hypothetical protein